MGDLFSKRVVNGRYFNAFKYTPEGYLNKSSQNAQKILDEIYWYTNIPPELSQHTAKLKQVDTSAISPNYSLELYDLPSLASLFLANEMPLSSWKNIIKKLFSLVKLFQSYPVELTKVEIEMMYYKKTMKRLKQLKQVSFWNELFNERYIVVNDKKYANHFNYIDQIGQYIQDSLVIKNHMSIIHGDLCLSNILYDAHKEAFILLDPRGRWNKQSIYGDIKYDIAKLRHSFCGYYDFLTTDKFSLKEHSIGNFTFHTNISSHHAEISTIFDDALVTEGYSKQDISFIESLLFLSMIPLHAENMNHQKAMYLKGIMLLNDTLHEK